jgi:hypothetical protein
VFKLSARGSTDNCILYERVTNDELLDVILNDSPPDASEVTSTIDRRL